jgi:DNA-binding transcriptional ArsR family regulator
MDGLREALGISAANISHHLKALETANLITRKREHGTTLVTTNREVARLAGSMLLVIAGVKPTEEQRPATDGKRKGRGRGKAKR